MSATRNSGDFKPARYAALPAGPQIVLWAPELVTIFSMTSPLCASTTFQCGPSSDGRKIFLPSGVIDIRSQPPSYVRSHSTCSVARSKHINWRIVLM